MHLLYETLRYRALEHKVSPNILSMTDQMVLTVFIKLSRHRFNLYFNGITSIILKFSGYTKYFIFKRGLGLFFTRLVLRKF